MTTDDVPLSLTARAIAAVHSNAQRASLPREAFLSLPLPIIHEQRPHLVCFWASQGGPANRRTDSAPYVRTTIDPEHLERADFERLAPGALDIAADASLKPTIGGSVAAGERQAVMDDFYVMTDAVMALYASKSAAIGLDAKALLDRYWLQFDRLAVIALLPAYRALNPHFFEWLASLAEPPPVARPGGVYACDSGAGDVAVVKVLVVQDGAVHARMYKDRFATRPVMIDLNTLTVASGHVPLSLEGFASWHPVLLAREPVNEAELVGYRLWQKRASVS